MPRVIRPATVVCCAVTALVALTSCASTPQSDAAATDRWQAPSAATPTPTPEPAPAMLVFGDSWTHGLAATDAAHAYPHLTGEILGWDVTALGENGSGYLHPGELGGFYGTRVAELDPKLSPDVIVVQGSINDRGEPVSALPRAARAVWNVFERTYPDANLVVLGPAPNTLPLDESIAKIDDVLADAAASEGIDYISPIAEGWFSDDNIEAYIDAGAAYHPSNAGHAYLAERLAADLEQIDPLSPFVKVSE
ncbi:MAG TPA: SGNH/GDSL hydrolase family protein [Microbacterium sp.]|nr:SGNH/GDSL hydrolase family protein [Microbacterium sp.]